MGFEHYDSGRTKLFSQENFNGSFERDNVIFTEKSKLLELTVRPAPGEREIEVNPIQLAPLNSPSTTNRTCKP
jgi:hypothetical protein